MSYHKTPALYYSTIFDMSKDVVITIDYNAYTTVATGSGGFTIGILPFYRVAPDGYSGGAGLAYSDDTTLDGVTSLSATGILDTHAGIGVDFSGMFATSATGTGGVATARNAFTIRGRATENYPLYTTTGNLTAHSTPFVLCDTQSVSATKRIRVRLSDFGSRILIDAKLTSDRYFVQYLDYFLPYRAPDYVRFYIGFDILSTTTHLSVQNININAFDTVLEYSLSAQNVLGLSPSNPLTMQEGDILSAVNVYSSLATVASAISALGPLILFTNQDSGMPYVADNYSATQRYAENRAATAADSFILLTYS